MEVGGIQTWGVAVFTTLGIRKIPCIISDLGEVSVLGNSAPDGSWNRKVIFSPILVLMKRRLAEQMGKIL